MVDGWWGAWGAWLCTEVMGRDGWGLQLQVETKLCIRDALYRLARSAMRRKGPGGWDGEGECESGLVSESGDGASDGVESSGNSDPCSSSRVSR